MVPQAHAGPVRNRGDRAILSSATGIAARLSLAVGSLAVIPLLLGYLGNEGYGVWVTATVLMAWIGLAHLGVPASLINHLARVDGTDAPGRAALVASSWWVSVGLAILIGCAIVALDAAKVWSVLFNVSGPLVNEARIIGVTLFAGAALLMPLSITAAVLRADQAGYIANVADVARVVLMVVSVALVVWFDLGVAWLAIGYAGAPLVVAVATTFLVLGRRVAWPRRRHVDAASIRRVMRVGFGFLGIGLAGLVISSTDVVVIAQVLGPAAIPTYSVAFSLLLLFASLELAVLDSVWPAYAEASARGDRSWIQTTHRRIMRTFVILAVIFAASMMLIGRTLIGAWAGPAAVPPASLLATLGAIAIVQAVILPYGRILTALGHVRRNTELSLTGALINLPLSIALAPVLGVTGVAVGTLTAYLATGWFLIRSASKAIDRVGGAEAGGIDATDVSSATPTPA